MIKDRATNVLSVARMLLGSTLVPPPVVPGQTSHFLLLTLKALIAHVLKKPLGLFFPERRGLLAIVSYRYVAIFGLLECKSEVC